MPIRPELRHLYPRDWKDISYHVRFVREQGRCQFCGRRHGETVHRLRDGRWFDPTINQWRDGSGQPCTWPDMFEFSNAKETLVVLAAAHLDNNPANCNNQNLASLCQRCHIVHDAPYHAEQRKLTIRARGAIGDLFLGEYDDLKVLLALSYCTA